MRILIAEDEVSLAKGLKFLLEKNNFTVDIVHDGADALAYCESVAYDAVILDIMMPKKDGLSVLSELRAGGSAVPVMLLTAKAEIEDRVAGLDRGADDYLPKPFATQEFLARVRALVRRNAGYSDKTLAFGNTRLDCGSYELRCGENAVRLNNKEFQVLELFFRNPRRVFSSEHIMDKLWNLESDVGIDVVWTYIGFVRKKLRGVGAGVEIRTVRGAGYALEELPC
jgi:DNA-binding response OmpR family regulator